MELFVIIYEREGKMTADLIPEDDDEGRKWLSDKAMGFSYWFLRLDDPECLVHIWFEADFVPDDIREDWNGAIAEQISEQFG